MINLFGISLFGYLFKMSVGDLMTMPIAIVIVMLAYAGLLLPYYHTVASLRPRRVLLCPFIVVYANYIVFTAGFLLSLLKRGGSLRRMIHNGGSIRYDVTIMTSV